MANKFSPLNDQNEDQYTVISFPSKKSLFKAGDLFSSLRHCFYRYGIQELYKQLTSKGGFEGTIDQWQNQGVECEVLRPGRNWKKGKIRINVTVEFCPDEAESPLDDIRQEMNQNEAT